MSRYYYSISRPYIISSRKEGLLIRGIQDSDIAFVYASNKWAAGEKIGERIKKNEL